MFARVRRALDRLLRRLRLKPLSLAEKCRLQFGAAVLLSLTLALLIPYLWMGKLTQKIALDAGRAVADTVYARHFRLQEQAGGVLPPLTEAGAVQDPNHTVVMWLPMEQPDVPLPVDRLTSQQQQALREALENADRKDRAWIAPTAVGPANFYIRVVRAQDACLSCHDPEGSAQAFNKSELLGAIVARTPAREYAKTLLINRISAIIAGLLAATAAMVAFYAITQRIILRPIRQLRGLANNIAEGNLEARSAIRSGDEFERLAEAFNHMLDVLQESQEQLSQANKQLDAKIGELSERNIELYKANKLKSEFLANMSHEVRTPLNAILGFAQLLYERPGADVEKSKRYANNIISSGRSLLNLINDLLDLAKAEAGRMEMHIEKTSIGHLCQTLLEFFSPVSSEKGIRVKVHIDPDVPIVSTDAGKLRQILYNLLSNALKFTPPKGRIAMRARMLNEKTVRISVSDNGPGIARENQDRIFEKFRQLDGSITRQGDGTGLGLAICRELSALLAGEVSVDSELGKGATFHVDLPVALALSTGISDVDQRIIQGRQPG